MLDQRRESVEDIDADFLGEAADRVRLADREAAGEHRQPFEKQLLWLAQQVIAPADRGLQRALALGGVT